MQRNPKNTRMTPLVIDWNVYSVVQCIVQMKQIESVNREWKLNISAHIWMWIFFFGISFNHYDQIAYELQFLISRIECQLFVFVNWVPSNVWLQQKATMYNRIKFDIEMTACVLANRNIGLHRQHGKRSDWQWARWAINFKFNHMLKWHQEASLSVSDTSDRRRKPHQFLGNFT